MKKRFTEEQILDFLKQAEAGVPVKELCRRHGFSDASFYIWRAKFSGMTVPDAKRLKDLELENSRLKKLLAEAHLDIEALKVVARGKGKPDSSTGSSAGDAGSNRHLPAPCLSADRAISLGAALSTPRQRAKHQAANPTRGTGTGAPAFRLSAPAYPAAARWRAGQPQADLSPVPVCRFDGETAEAPSRCRHRARTPKPTERAESGVVDGLRLRCAQYGAED